MKKLRVFVSMVLLASMISLTACGSKAATENKNNAKETSTEETAKDSQKTEEKKASYPLTIKDDLKNEVVLKEKPKKIAAISNTYLDILYAAGGKSIARTDSRNPNLPKEIKDLESVGAVYNVDVEKLISLKPDLVISQFGLQNKIVPILQKSNIPVISLNMKSYDDVLEKLKLMGQITENEDKVEKIINDMNSKKEELTKKLPEKSKKVAILYVTGKDVSLKLENSIAGNVAKELKLENIASGLKAEKMGSENVPFSMEKIVESNPDVILVTTMVHSREKAEQCIKKNLESNPAWKELKAVKENKMVFLPQSHFLSNPGDKYVESIEFMARAVYPEVYGNVEEWESNKKVEPKEITNTLNDGNKTKFYRLNIIFILIIGAIVSFFISNMFGTMKLSVKEICTALINTTMDSKRIVIWNVRVPRSILAALVGINLSISGAILQGVMKNPLADPGIIGISSGAGLTGIVLLIIFPEHQGLLTPVAFLGAMGAALLIYALAWKGGIQPMRVILSGVAVSSLLGAGISALLVFYSDRVHGALMFMTGGLSARSWPQVSVILPYTIIGVIIAILLSEKMNILILGDDVARSLGLNVEGTRMIMTAVAAILAASAVSVVGLLGFVGLIVPHTARIIVGSNYKYLIPTSGLLGAIVLLLCDTLSRTVFSPVEIPVGVVMAVLGAPFFLYLFKKGLGDKMKEFILQGRNITVKIKEKTIIKDINISVSSGEIVSIIGPNGSGKTTLLKVLSRNLKGYTGDVFLNGKPIKTFNNKEVAKNMAYVSQSYNASLDLTVRELITYGRYAYKSLFKGNSDEDIKKINWALERTNLTQFQNRKLNTLSGGERQRAWIAMSLAQKPKILLLDEPTTYLDICHQVELLQLIKSLNEEDNLTVLMVLHDINQAAQFSHRLFVIKEGILVKDGSSKEIITESNLKNIFNINSKVFKRDDTDKPYFYVL